MKLKEVDKLRPPSNEELQTPWLLYTHGHGKHRQIQTFYSLGKSKSYLKSIPELRHKEVIDCFHGWLVLRDGKDECVYSLLNIGTLHTIILPRLPSDVSDERLSSCLLTSSPKLSSLSTDDDNCMFLLVFNDAGVLYFCRPRADSDACNWVLQSVKLEDGTKAHISQLVTLNGVVHGRAYVEEEEERPVRHDIFCIVDELNTLTLRPLQIGDPSTESVTLCDFSHGFMLESCGRIYYAMILKRAINNYLELDNMVAIKVWELNFEEKNWMEVKSLNGRAFILNMSNNRSNSWCWGDGNNNTVGVVGIQENCVCFLNPRGDDDQEPDLIIVSTNLVDQTWTILSQGPNLVSPNDYPVWVMPRLPPIETIPIPIPNQLISNNSTNEAHEDSSFFRFNELPLDIIKSLPNYMHLFEYWNFRATCKMFHTTLPAPLWRTNNKFPLFLFFKNENGLCQLIDPCRSDDARSSTLVLFSQDHFTLVFSKNGWLLVAAPHHFKFYNLFTGVTGVFPSIFFYGPTFRSIGFSSDPTCSKCLTVALFNDLESSLIIYYLQSGDETWNEVEFDLDDEGIEFSPTDCAPVYLEGAFYFLDCSGNLGVFELVDEEPSWRVYDMPDNVDSDDFNSCHLVECEGELYAVFVHRIGVSPVQVFRFDNSNKNWVDIDELGNRILFISKTSCYSIVSSDRAVKNRVYLPKIQGKNIVFYSLDTKMYHILGSGDTREDLYGTNQPIMCCWV